LGWKGNNIEVPDGNIQLGQCGLTQTNMWGNLWQTNHQSERGLYTKVAKIREGGVEHFREEMGQR